MSEDRAIHTTEEQPTGPSRWEPSKRQVLWAVGMTAAWATIAFLIVKIASLYPDIWKVLLGERVLTLIGITATLMVIIVLLAIGGTSLAWTGFANRPLWEWLELLGTLAVPIMVTLVGIYFTAQQSRTQNEVQEQRAQAAALQAYLNQMGTLLLAENGGLRESEEGSEERTLARARTITALEALDPDRKGRLLQFLIESNLITGENPVLELSTVDATKADLSRAYLGEDANLSGANLSEANLSGAYLWGTDLSCDPPVRINMTSSLTCTDLSGADLSEADLNGANLSCAEASIWWNEGQMDRTGCVDLSGANLSGADLTNTDLSGALLTGVQGIPKVSSETDLEGATMPNGQRMPLGLPEKRGSPHAVDIPAGEYDSDEFEPAFRFEVDTGPSGIDEGWGVLRSETPGELALEHATWNQLIFTKPQSVFGPDASSELKKGCIPPLGFGTDLSERNAIMLQRCLAPKNVDEWISWFQDHPNLQTSEPVAENVGGMSGKRIDVKVTSEPKDYSQKVCGAIPCVPLFPTSDVSGSSVIVSEFSHDNSQDRFVIVDVQGEPVIIKIATRTGGSSKELDKFLLDVRKILDTVEWKPRDQEYANWFKK